ncbi:unnamed protein product [Ectocarpus sp. 4 AP-2014]
MLNCTSLRTQPRRDATHVPHTSKTFRMKLQHNQPLFVDVSFGREFFLSYTRCLNLENLPIPLLCMSEGGGGAVCHSGIRFFLVTPPPPARPQWACLSSEVMLLLLP